LFKIFQALGSPNEVNYPGVSQLPDWKSEFPQWSPVNIASIVPTLEPAGVDLLSKMLEYVPSRRITAKAAVEHEYFAELKQPSSVRQQNGR
jgi:cyclin-dependent kinase 2